MDRRSLFRAGGVLAATSALPATVSPASASVDTHRADRAPTLTTRNPLVEQRADPFITRPVDGMYYLTGSVPEYDRVVVRGASTVDGLATARERTIWRRPASGPMGGFIWAPELHRIGNRWYFYFAAGDSDDPFRIRTYILESPNADPRAEGWLPPRRMVTGWDSFTLDATTFEHRGRRYFLWAQNEPGIATNSNLYLAEMASPLAIAGTPVRISVPTASWETQGFRVNEGPAVLIRNGRVFVTFSASATDARYCMGLLTADENADLLDARSWTKSPNPVFSTNVATSQFGPGHNSFTVAEDGTDVLVYHARDYRDIVGDPLFDPNRHTRVQRLYWNEDGTPSFGIPVGRGGPISRLSPVDTPQLVLRHFEFRLRFEGNVRDLADSQFRFVPGNLGAGTVSLRSVNFPDRYVRVVADDLPRTDPFADTDAYGRATSFLREPGLADRSAVSLRLSTEAGAYLAHDGIGRLVVARPGRASAERQRATFRIG